MQQDISFVSKGITLSGTLTIPTNQQLPPCVVMVHGSGPQDRDGNIGGFTVQIFKFLADALALQGIASLRHDKRGCGKSQGNFSIVGLSEMVDDATAAVTFLTSQPDVVNPKRIYVLGHSEGAVLVPEIGQSCPNIAGLIMLCASLRSFEEDGIKNAEVLNRDLDKMTGLKGKLARFFFYTTDPAKTMSSLRKKVETTRAQRIWTSYTRVSTKFYRELFNYNIHKWLSQTTRPILAIGGSKDFQCHPDDTLRIQNVTSAPVKTHIIQDMDHMLRRQVGETTLASYKMSGLEPILPQIHELIIGYILKKH
ncbi:putative hydrolase [Pseudoalteromonas luteoviolacea B = ATCC 29581]|nr:putative hydrolase [Pseudoalteromonas luteoviolacea B = ATCC 29581]